MGGRGASDFVGFLLYPPDVQALAFGFPFGLCLVRLVCFSCHIVQLLLISFSTGRMDSGYIHSTTPFVGVLPPVREQSRCS